MEAESIVMNGFRFEPVRFHSAVPLPPPQCKLPLPEGCREGSEDAPLANEQCQAKGLISGAMHTLTNLLGTAALALEKARSTSSHTKLRDRFPEIEQSRIVCEYECVLFTQNGELPGSLCLTTSFLLFIPQSPNATDICIPYSDILTVQRLINSKEAVAKAPHFDNCAEGCEADALQFFACTGQLFIFKEFLLKSNIDDCLNVFDHLWRTLCEVPFPNRKYIPAEQFIQPILTVIPPSVVDARSRRRNRRRSTGNNNADAGKGTESPNKAAGAGTRTTGDNRRKQSAFTKVARGANRDVPLGAEVPVPPANVSRSQSTEELDTWKKVQQSDRRREGVLADKHEELKTENDTCNTCTDNTCLDSTCTADNKSKENTCTDSTCNNNTCSDNTCKENACNTDTTCKDSTCTDNTRINDSSLNENKINDREQELKKHEDECNKMEYEGKAIEVTDHPLKEEPLSERLLVEQIPLDSAQKTEA